MATENELCDLHSERQPGGKKSRCMGRIGGNLLVKEHASQPTPSLIGKLCTVRNCNTTHRGLIYRPGPPNVPDPGYLVA